MPIYFEQFYQDTALACVTDLTPPTFSGISGLSVNPDGSMTASWSAATDSTPQIRYEVYVQGSTATGLFNLANIQQIVTTTSARIFTLPNLTYLQNGVTYYVGVRAVDGVGNRETNTASQNAVSTGVLAAAVKYEGIALLSVNEANELLGLVYLHGDGKAVSTLLGTATFSVYDETETLLPAFTQTGLTANANGVYTLAPVSASTLDPFTHYRARMQITHNSVVIDTYAGFIIGE
jgi:hypothetical protein